MSVERALVSGRKSATPCKNKNSQETEKSPRKFPEPSRKPRVIFTDNSLEFGKCCEDLSWNHRTSTLYRSETNGIAERAVRRAKEETSAVFCNLDRTISGGRIPWNAVAICEMSKTSWQKGKLRAKDDLENQTKDQLFHLVHWWNTSQIPRDTVRIHQFRKESITRNLSMICFDCGEFGKETFWLLILKS